MRFLHIKKVASYLFVLFCSIIFQSLIQELDLERERRWKAEQAALKLVDHVKELQIKGTVCYIE